MSQKETTNVTKIGASDSDPVAAVIVPKLKDIGAFKVRRALPSVEARAVGPFIFFDQMGPAILEGETMLDVRPHPHIGLATLTWMVDGVIMHRDSLGYAQEIKPGEVNLMTAGRGIVHSERTPDALRGKRQSVFGVQSWLALSEKHQETEPSFQHFDATEIPVHEAGGIRAVLVMGTAWGMSSPVKTFADTFCADVTLDAEAQFDVPDTVMERAIYVLDGNIAINGTDYDAGKMIVLKTGRAVTVKTNGCARLMLIGGAPLDGPRHLYWNFASTSKDRIEEAKLACRDGQFPTVPGDDQEFIPLPD